MRAPAIAFVLLAALGGARAESRGVPCVTLEACDAVIRTNPGLAAYERRGYLHLTQRRDLEDLQKAIADFSAAIAIEARPFSLYARGMARLQTAESCTDKLGRLQDSTMQKIDAHNTSFWAATNRGGKDGSGLGLLERQRVKTWLHRAYGEIERLNP